ncbi:hypothetical protein G7Y89_g8666 [Cudoniella acicularis]|uniref:Histidine acid phosphatase n=1 Tax=Cudoniella acicularis TaxID=354080 RepID=A0A8H4RHR5_9HELO|nr:hypothetical protein G7Y89_g8666 [Cudoniella acicularis]
MLSIQLASLALIAVLTPAVSAETVLGAFIYHRHGDRTTKSYPPTKLTPLGYQEVYQSGGFYNSRYVSNTSSSQIYGISSVAVKNSQISVQAAVDDVLDDSAIGFLQGLYPPIGLAGAELLANGSTIEPPLGGYQLIPVNELASLASVANSGDATWLQGASGCQNAITDSNEYFFSQDFMDFSNKTASFYQSILPVINNTFTSATDIYKNAYAVWDLIQVSLIHNKTIQSSELLTPSTITQLQTLADHHEFALAYNASSPVRAISGMSLAGMILQQLNGTLTSTGPLLSIQFGEYASFLSFFGLASLPSVSANFTGIVDFASSMAFELVTNATVSGTTYPALSDISVRFMFSNGSAADAPFMPYPLFGQSSLEVPWNTFVNEMNNFAVTNQTAFCQLCGSASDGCSTTSTVATPSPTPTAATSVGGSGMSAAIGGVIGAMVTLAVILGVEAVVLLIGGLKVVKKSAGGSAVELGAVTGGKI